MRFATIKTSSGIELIDTTNGKSYSVSSKNRGYDEVISALASGDNTRIIEAVDVAKALENMGLRVDYANSTVYYGEEKVSGSMVDRLFEIKSMGLDTKPLVAFIERVCASGCPEYLYTFLEVGKMPITEDGHFLAYKVVTADYKDKHTRKIDNSVGATPSMKREDVDSRRDVPHSSGLHFCSFEYIKKFLYSSGDRVVLVKIDPRDVVMIPSDYNNTKGRCCRYHVIADVTDQIRANDPTTDILAEDSESGYSKLDASISEKYEEYYESDEEWDSSDSCW